MEKNIALKKQIANQSKEIEVLKTREMSDIPPLVPKAGFQSDASNSIYDWIPHDRVRASINFETLQS